MRLPLDRPLWLPAESWLRHYHNWHSRQSLKAGPYGHWGQCFMCIPGTYVWVRVIIILFQNVIATVPLCWSKRTTLTSKTCLEWILCIDARFIPKSCHFFIDIPECVYISVDIYHLEHAVKHWIVFLATCHHCQCRLCQHVQADAQTNWNIVCLQRGHRDPALFYSQWKSCQHYTWG